MRSGWLGVPYLAYAGICAVLALVWAGVWPQDLSTGQTGLHFALIRWGHSLTWLSLAAACLCWAFHADRIGRILALAGLAGYVAFLLAVVTARTSS